ncbi:MAG: septum formation initiator family protein [Oscillospiraceae bacterium]|nr:septum formation initiator family protein [Oscillospiraceae bacterium]
MSTAASKVAPDLSRFDTRPQVREAVAVEAPPVRVLPVPRERVATRPHARLRVHSVVIFLCVTALLIFIVYSYMRMAEVGQKSRDSLKEIQMLQKEEALLLKQREDLIDVQEIERIAREELDMVKPSENQIIYIDLSGEDHAEVLED